MSSQPKTVCCRERNRVLTMPLSSILSTSYWCAWAPLNPEQYDAKYLYDLSVSHKIIGEEKEEGRQTTHALQQLQMTKILIWQWDTKSQMSTQLVAPPPQVWWRWCPGTCGRHPWRRIQWIWTGTSKYQPTKLGWLQNFLKRQTWSNTVNFVHTHFDSPAVLYVAELYVQLMTVLGQNVVVFASCFLRFTGANKDVSAFR